jgi:23S rRNA (adenine2030-N6)-methyltransferase
MYSYQHRYHAGNFADLHKHLVLIAILKALQQKNTAFCVLDAFAGEGIYDLNCQESQKNQEYLNGFEKIRKSLEPNYLIQELLTIAKKYQTTDQIFIYPGSPAIIHTNLRTQDQAIFIENHPQAYTQLKKHFSNQQQIHIHKRDGIEAINALIPFKTKRGLIFIDPSYEVKTEYNIICSLVKKAYLKFPQGIYMIWYPLLQENKHVSLLTDLQNTFNNNIWQHELVPIKNNTEGLYGSGIIIINPPWQFNTIIQDGLRLLLRLF